MNRQKKEIVKKQQLQLLAVTPIDSFRGQYRFLSNFFPAVVVYDGRTFQSTEAAYQSAKSLDPLIRDQFVPLSAGESKTLGQAIKLRPDWEEVKNGIMLELLQQKFSQDEFQKKLKATAPRLLIEGNNWHDTHFGICNGCRKFGNHPSMGKNMLGCLLMEVRDGVKYLPWNVGFDQM